MESKAEKPKKEQIEQIMTTLVEQEEVISKPAPISESPEIKEKVITLPKPKTASAVHHKPQKSLKLKKKQSTAPIRLESIRKQVPALEPAAEHEKKTIDETRWESQEKICKELSDMYQTELKRIYELQGRFSAPRHAKPKPESVPRKNIKDKMRRTGGGFMQTGFFSQN